jgi:hypothetical protein
MAYVAYREGADWRACFRRAVVLHAARHLRKERS